MTLDTDYSPEKEPETSPVANDIPVIIESLPETLPVASGIPVKIESLREDHQDGPLVSVPPSSVVRSPPDRKRQFIGCLVFLVLIAIAIPVIILATKDEEEAPVVEVPTTVDFSTGVALITSYEVTAEISSRLAKTTIATTIENGLDCSSIHSITLQLPLTARVASVKTISENGCETSSEVKTLDDARKTFLESASEGLPGVYVEAQTSSTHSIQVAIPPLGSTDLEVVIEELVHTKLGAIRFEVPLVPNELLDSIVLDIDVKDINNEGTNGTKFSLDIGPEREVNATSSYFLSIPDARRHSLPKLLSGKYEPAPIPSSGLTYQAGECFEHFFRPPSAESMPKNILFLLDNSNGREAIKKSTEGIKDFIDTLTPDDTFTIQTFASRGTMDLWGPLPATADEKVDAKLFLDEKMTSTDYSRDVHEAVLEGLLRARRDAENSSDGTVTILFLLLNGRANLGETDRRRIVENVYKRNRDGQVKIFALGFENASDMQLLGAIATTNGGVATSLSGGINGDVSSEVLHFMQSEFGEILLADVHVALKSKNSLEDKEVNYGQTQQDFPLLTDGYEIVVRGLLGKSNTDEELRVVTTARTKEGPLEWTATTVTPDMLLSSDEEDNSSRCYRSYAHSRITQLMRLRDAADLVEDSILKDLASLMKPCEEEHFADCIENEALGLALEAGVVAKGLTGMVTVDDEECLSFEGETEICRDGGSKGSKSYPYDDVYEARSSGCFRPSSFASLILCASCFMLFVMFALN